MRAICLPLLQEFMENFRKLREEEESRTVSKVKVEEPKEEQDADSEDVSAWRCLGGRAFTKDDQLSCGDVMAW